MVVAMTRILMMVMMLSAGDSGFKGEVQVSATSALQCSAQVRDYLLHSGGKRLSGRGNRAEPATSTKGI